MQRRRQGTYLSTLTYYRFGVITFCFPQEDQSLVYESAVSGLADLGWAHSCTCVQLVGLLEFG